MAQLAFEALGTAWTILIDEPASVEAGFDFDALRNTLIDKTAVFDQRFSRFKSDTEAVQFRSAAAGTYPISEEFSLILDRADRLRRLTDGAFDPAVGGLLEAAGYDAAYSLQPQAQTIVNWQLPQWQVDTQAQTVTIDGPVIFDIGGTGKGYWIDQLSSYLHEVGLPHHLVEGGGDMMATTKANGEGYRIALEWPGREDMAIGTLTLRNQGFAASDIFRRQWRDWNHLVNVPLKQPVQHLHGVMAVAGSAWQADELTSLLSLTDPHQYAQRVPHVGGEYLVVLADGSVSFSPSWPGELF